MFTMATFTSNNSDVEKTRRSLINICLVSQKASDRDILDSTE